MLFFNRFMRNWERRTPTRRRRMPDAEIVGHDEEPLTYDQVAEEFERAAGARPLTPPSFGCLKPGDHVT